jgi:hypothetical protein
VCWDLGLDLDRTGYELDLDLVAGMVSTVSNRYAMESVEKRISRVS